ncbi:MAG: hypothetical protein LBD75_02505 [Candidatus Peribacteria bacterium]|jgi:hypothetical protein|nr:hypothetical protein [Candidatus Peribacteria bacterium]
MQKISYNLVTNQPSYRCIIENQFYLIFFILLFFIQMKKILLSFLGLGIIVGGVGVLYAQTTTSTTAVSKTQAAATVIAQLLNEKDQEYVQKFYTAFDALVAKYTTAKDTARVTILNEMKNVFLSKVKVLPAGYNVSCYDTSKPA